ncbi:hypothetical protein [Guptibacillus hwajinpoensis]|uniref:hypothetical protein n=1 Tax=Guptibacillus hwajinpoensis TaxID=208199 RepID=UPI0037358288
MSDQTFTQEQVDEFKNEWLEKELNPIKNELEEVRGKLPKELTEEEKAFKEKENELWNKEVNFTLKENGLSQFAPFVHAEDGEQLGEQLKMLNQIVNEMKIDSSYKPEDHKRTTEYDKFEKENNTTGMIGSKIANLFK